MRGAQWWRDSPKTSSHPDRFYNTGLSLRGRKKRRRRRRRSALRAKATVPRKRRERPTDTSFLGRPWTERESQKPRRPPSTSEEETLSVKKEQLSNRVPLPGKSRDTVSRLSTCQTALGVGRQSPLLTYFKSVARHQALSEGRREPQSTNSARFDSHMPTLHPLEKVFAKFAS